MTKILLSKRINACRRVAVSLLLLLSLVNKSVAGVDPPVIQALDGSLGQVALDSTVMVEDAKFFNAAYYGKLIKPYPLRNVVSLEINEFTPIVIQSDFTVTVRLAISFVRNDSTTGYEERNFQVQYQTGNPYPHKDVYIFSNKARVSVQIISISKNVPWDAYQLVKVVNQLQSLPNYNYDCDSNAVKEINDSAWSATTTKDELPVYWPPSIGADEYDLEWTYIDSIALASGRYGDPEEPDANLIFDNNSSRVTITGTYYAIPIIYDNAGYLFFRVRSVQWQPGGGRNEANWSSDYPDGLGVFYYRGHERLLNWQATTTYAEDGKRKVVVQYFDGSLRGRQTVTKDNSTNTTVVAESFYDYQGRPVIQVLPAPTISGIIKYTPGFNVGLNGNIYDKFNYDTLASAVDICSTAAAEMDTVSGAARYYSPNNELVDSNFNKYIPNAFGYPFTEVQYTQDNTGRISSQSGVGEKFRINGGHDTRYMYTTANQRQLDALFGTEVGDASHYFKTLVRDANGQYSVSYTDMHGRTVATALAGTPPDSIKLDTLASYDTKALTQKLSDPASVVIRDLVMEHKNAIAVTKEDDYVFTYKLDPDIMRMEGCSEIEICYECLYDLEITITDDCNNCKLGGAPFDTLVKNFSIGALDTSCNGGPGFDFSFTKRLKEGSYEITKKLTVSKYGMDYYRDSFFLAANACRDIDSFLNEQRQLYAGVLQCQPTCSTCKDSLGTWNEFWERYVTNTGIDSADIASHETMARTAYDKALEECNLICDTLTSDANDIRRNMLMDMTPSSGQYANIDNDEDTYSIFFSRANGISPDTAAIYQQINNYLDEDGNPDQVFDETSGTLVSPNQLSPEVFAQKFKSSWAQALLPHHPEYCKLTWYDSLKYSHEWDRRFEAVESWQEAKAKGYLNPTNSTESIFLHFAGTPGQLDLDSMPLYASGFWKQRLEDSLKNFRFRPNGSPDWLTMWTVATVAAVCPTSSGSCFGKFFTTENTFSYEEGLCDGEMDMAWRTFRQMYLDVKRSIQNEWLKTKCASFPNAASLFSNGHQAHFGDALEMIATTDLDLSTNTATIGAEYQQLINEQYATTCAGYAVMWWKQLAPCNFELIRDSAKIIDSLIRICREGSDYYHPYGSSSISPSSSYGWESFEHFIREYCLSVGIDYNENCNAYLITAPRPYSNQAANSNKPIYSAPDDCECTAINNYYTKYEASTGFGSFSSYLLKVHNTIVSTETLNTLLALCGTGADTTNCPVLSQPVYLPPAFQCFTGDVCITCDQFKTHNQAFQDSFPAAHPAIITAAIPDSATWQWNQLYEQFMNYRLGFALSADDYLHFRQSCGLPDSTGTIVQYDTSTVTCDELNGLGKDFFFQYFYPSSGFADLYMTTFAGNKTPPEGPKGVFNVNHQLTGMTVDGTTAQIDSSFAALWNGDTVNQAVGTIYPIGDGEFRLYLNPGQQVPCNGLIGQRFYQFEASTDDTLSSIHTTLGSYIDWGDSTHLFPVSTGSFDHDVVTRYNITGSFFQFSRIVGTDFQVPVYIGLTHFYPHTTTRTTYTVTVYHTDTIGRVGFYEFNRDTATAQLSNLRGYFPQHLRTLFFFGTRDSTFNRTSEIRNWAQISTIQYIELGHANVPGLGPVPFIHNNLGSFANNHDLRHIRLEPAYSLINGYQTPGVLDNIAGKHLYENFPDMKNNFPELRACVLGGFDERLQDMFSFNFELPKLKLMHTFGDVAAGFTDTFYNQVARATMVDSSLTFIGYSLATNPDPPTSASTTARNDLIGRDWYLNHVGQFMGQPTYGPYDLYAKDSVLPFVHPFTAYANQRLNTSFTWQQLNNFYIANCGYPPDFCTVSPEDKLTLCGRSEPVFPMAMLDVVDNCSDTSFFIQSKAQELYRVYLDSLKNAFDSAYLAKCMAAYKLENFTVRHVVNEFHHTLYYYDQAGNLIKTVPPAGVRANYDSLWLDSVYIARLADQAKLPAHELVTQYRYNTLNQAVAQKSPDGGKTEFWYDRLGRLTLSRNARQLANSSGNNHLFSFTRYDQLGRITQVGQLRETATTSVVDDDLTRKDSALQAWFNTYENYRHQLTTTVYDAAYFTGAYDPLTVYQRNLRNRVSYVSYSDTTGLAVAFNNAVFYSYDAAGNVDTLLQDYGCGSCGVSSVYNLMNRNGNRWKKIVYNYDLVSGKVNTVAFQRGWSDQFFQRYAYDAENRLILAESSRDSVVWEREATYQYYKHGPLARMVLGHQQVQGIDYAHTLQGWLKGMNSTGGSIAHDMGGDGLASGANQYTARDALGLTLNYFGGEYNAINPGILPFPNYSGFLPGGEYRPLYNGNISSSSVFNRTLSGQLGGDMLFYNYRYDQLNRITGMDVYNGFNIAGNNWNAMTAATVNTTDSVMREKVAYDANGNMVSYRRNHAGGLLMDNLQYKYYPGTNQLRQVTDGVTNDGQFGIDIDHQADTSNYVYDAIGNLVQDKKEQITGIKWNVYGKITEITRNSTGTVPVTNIKYLYDALGNRIGKVFDLGGQTRYTWYVRDAQGNVLSIYDANFTGTHSVDTLFVVQSEQYLYGSSRLGFHANAQAVENGPVSMEFYSGGQFFRGNRQYELSNHLGNVLAVISDKKFGVSSGGSLNDYYNPQMLAGNDYYPFGMVARLANQGIPYTRFGFNGKEFDWEAKGWMNQVDYGMRVYDPRIGRFLSVDPLTKQYPHYTPYQFAGNTPIQATDLDGEEEYHYTLTFNQKTGIAHLKLDRVVNEKSFLWISWTPTLRHFVEYPQSTFGNRSFTFTEKGYSTHGNTIANFEAWLSNPAAFRNDPTSIDPNGIMDPGQIFYSDAASGLADVNAALKAFASYGGAGLMNRRILMPTKQGETVSTPTAKTDQQAVAATGNAATSNAASTQNVNLQQRAQEIHTLQPTFAQSKTTTAVGAGTNAAGKSVTLVASSNANLTPAQKAGLKPGELPISNKMLGEKSNVKIHAEQKIINYANANNINIEAVAPSRPACPSCYISVTNAGAKLDGKIRQ